MKVIQAYSLTVTIDKQSDKAVHISDIGWLPKSQIIMEPNEAQQWGPAYSWLFDIKVPAWLYFKTFGTIYGAGGNQVAFPCEIYK